MVVETKYVTVDREELRELREESAELSRLRAQPARQVGGDDQLSNDEIHNIAYEIAVTDERGGYFFEAEDLDKFVAEIRAALAPAAVAPEQWEQKLARLHPNIEPGKWPASWRKDAIEQELREFRLNRNPIPAGLLRRLCADWENGEDVTPDRANATYELRALLGKDEK